MSTRILILNWRSPRDARAGGAEQVTLKYAETLLARGDKVIWLSSFPSETNQQFKLPPKLRLVEIGNHLTVYLLAPFLYWFKFGGNIDLVVDQIHGLPFLTPLWALKSKKLAFIHEVAQEIWDEMFPLPLNLLGRWFEKFYFWFYKSTPFLTVSSSTAADLIKFGIQKSNITVIPNGLSLKPLNTSKTKQKSLTLIFVARLVKMKGIEDTIQLTYLLAKKYQDVKLYIIGQGTRKYANRLYQLVRNLNLSQNVVFLGFVSEEQKIHLYQKAHFLIHTSVREGFGLVVLEANSQGTPAIVYNSPGLRDIVKEGVNGFQVPRGDFKQMAKVVIQTFQDKHLYQQLCQSSIEYASQFKWSDSQRKFRKLIDALLKRS